MYNMHRIAYALYALWMTRRLQKNVCSSNLSYTKITVIREWLFYRQKPTEVSSIFLIAYLWYGIISVIVAIFVACIVSLLTGKIICLSLIY